ncbi:3-dehydroquinate dehydratase [bacterium]|nr:3-dehydroquinate dehydratase [bacterium]MBU1025941.1 3-dehydroquinate dehydratase [bacterium]
MNILVLHGPNLSTLGKREPEIYGTTTLREINALLNSAALQKNVLLKIFQSNHEGELIDLIEAHTDQSDALIINAGGLTHTSICLMDALKAFAKPVVEVHLTDPMQREEFRHTSYVGMAAEKSFVGEGTVSYIHAIEYLVEKLN